MVFQLTSRMGQRASGGGQFLEHDAGHPVLHSQLVPAGRQVPVVRVQSHPHNVAGIVKKQAELFRRFRGRLPVPGNRTGWKRERAGGASGFPLPANRAVSGFLDLSSHQQAPVRSRRIVVSHPVAHVPRAQREPQRYFDPGAFDRLSVQRPGDLQRAPER